MKGEEFLSICRSCEKNFCQTPQNIDDQTHNWIKEIGNHTYLFDLDQRYKEIVMGLKKEDVRELFVRLFVKDRKVMEVHIVSEKFRTEANGSLRKRNHYHVGNVGEFQGESERYNDQFVFKCI